MRFAYAWYQAWYQILKSQVASCPRAAAFAPLAKVTQRKELYFLQTLNSCWCCDRRSSLQTVFTVSPKISLRTFFKISMKCNVWRILCLLLYRVTFFFWYRSGNTDLWHLFLGNCQIQLHNLAILRKFWLVWASSKVWSVYACRAWSQPRWVKVHI